MNEKASEQSQVSTLYQGIVERAGKARGALAEKLQVPATWPEIVNAVSALCDEVERLRAQKPRCPMCGVTLPRYCRDHSNWEAL